MQIRPLIDGLAVSPQIAAREGRAVDDILARAQAAGYDLAGLAPRLAAELPT